MKLRICHLYPDLMNIYGDDGNIICLQKRCVWRGIEAELSQLTIGDKIDPDKYDIYFFGGGQDQQQIAVAEDLKKTNGKLLNKAVGGGAVVFAVCGGYQLLGHYYKPPVGDKLLGIGLLDAYTIAGSKRMIGNIVVELSKELGKSIQTSYNNRGLSLKIIGFENHSGKTFLEKGAEPLGKVVVGNGNNGQDKTEGAFSDTVFGCYLHGSVLPKNPHLADFLIAKALARRYGQVKLEKLNDKLEWTAHEAAVKRAYQTK